MLLNESEFNEQFTAALDSVIETMTETSEIDPAKFFSMVCILENLQFFAPVLYGAFQDRKKAE